MTNSEQPDLRLILVARKGEEKDATEAVEIWREAFSEVAPEGIEFCVWLTGNEPTVSQEIDACVHILHLNPLIDGYQRNPRNRMTWSPWGQKSGPNYQFFRILREMSALHPESWILQLELDTFPLRKVTPKDIPWTYRGEELWVVGAGIQNAREQRKSRGLVHHINGAAFYKLGDSNFQDFLANTWRLDLLKTIRLRPALAFDVMTANSSVVDGPSAVHENWRESREFFKTTWAMRNLLSNPSPSDSLLPNDAAWFVHLKGPEPQFFNVERLKD